MSKEKVMLALKAGGKAFVVAFAGALGFGAMAPGLVEAVLKIIGL